MQVQVKLRMYRCSGFGVKNNNGYQRTCGRRPPPRGAAFGAREPMRQVRTEHQALVMLCLLLRLLLLLLMPLLVLVVLLFMSLVHRRSRRSQFSKESQDDQHAHQLSLLNALPVHLLSRFPPSRFCATSSSESHFQAKLGLTMLSPMLHFCATSSRIRHLPRFIRLSCGHLGCTVGSHFRRRHRGIGTSVISVVCCFFLLFALLLQGCS